MNRYLSSAILSLSLASVACGSAEPADVLSGSQAIFDDDTHSTLTPVTDDSLGTVKIRSTAAGCIGILLTNQWVLTASTCVNDDDIRSPSGVTAELATTAGTKTAVEIITNADGFSGVALIRLQSPFSINSSTSSHYMPLYDGDAASLTGKTLRCYGRDVPTNTVRTAEFPISSVNAAEYQLGENAQKQQLWVYDWGAPCLLSSGPAGGVRYVTGTMLAFSRDSANRKISRHSFAGSYREWVYQRIAPQVQLVSTDSRAIDNLRLRVEFTTDGWPHMDYQDHGRLDHLITDRLYAVGGSWDGARYVGDFLTTTSHDYSAPSGGSPPKMIQIRKDEPRAVRNVRLHAEFTIAGVSHYDYEDLGDLVSTKNVILNAQGGSFDGTRWVGNFLRACQSPNCL